MAMLAEPLGHNWNSLLIAQDGEEKTVRAQNRWVAYYWDGEWHPIREHFNDAGDNWQHDESPWTLLMPKWANKRIKLVNEQLFNPLTRAVYNPGDFPELEMDHPDALTVEGVPDPNRPGRILYANAFGDGIDMAGGCWWEADYPRAEHLIQIRKAPENGGDAEIRERFFTPMLMDGWNGEPADIGPTGATLLTRNGDAGIRVLRPVAWYYTAEGELVTRPIQVIVQREAGFTLLRKICPRDFVLEALAAGSPCWFDETTTTVYPNETNCFDAIYTTSGNLAWSGVSNNSTATSVNQSGSTGNATGFTSSNTSSRWTLNCRAGLGFDTNVGAGASVSYAKLDIYAASKSNSFPAAGASGTVCGFAPGSPTVAATADWGTVNKATLLSDDAIAYASLSTGATPTTFTLNASGRAAIAVSGITWLMLLNANDQQASNPSWSTTKSTDWTIYLSNNGSSKPALTFTYTGGGGGGGSPGKLTLLGVGT